MNWLNNINKELTKPWTSSKCGLTDKGTVFIFSSNMSFLFRNRIISDFKNHLLLHISVKTWRESYILFVLPSSTNTWS